MVESLISQGTFHAMPCSVLALFGPGEVRYTDVIGRRSLARPVRVETRRVCR